ncbi:hypothetical protein [Pyxidicoccus xibeiensis]|uniref:hypothetical protein n=1 Tax=Pyxidicoccus xibeiensis TaxID=2906759 RepID=UPI0020A6F7AD|nr:hypothetical protein [Pyxidicoccus xibeiensis]MCP3140483.1 hypothetical protein [Pyxidicoccus xibeiensis]
METPTATASTARSRLEPLLVLAGIYFVHYLLLRTSLHAGLELPAARPFRNFPGYVLLGWDGEHYLNLARTFSSYAWPPLYPFALRGVEALLPRGGLPGAALLVNLASHAAIVLLAYAFVRGSPRLREVPPWLFAALMLFFPGHNVFFAAYTESLFLALSLGACVAWQRERLLLAAVLVGLALLARNMGVYLGAGLVAAEVLRAVSQRKLEPRRLLASLAWVPFFIGWNLWLRFVAGTDPVAATAGWQEELLTVHVPPGANPKLWVLRYLMLPGKKEALFFWASVAAAGYCWVRRLRVEALYIVFFLLSHAVYLYRPFPFSRYTSVLFPLTLMVADALRRWPSMQAVALALAVAVSHHHEVILYMNRGGEP